MFIRSIAKLMNAVAILVGAGLVAAAAPNPPQTAQDVNVVNTPSVNVANTGTQPVPTVRIDEPGRIPYQSTADRSDGSCAGAFECFFEFGSVPAGHRVVIQHVSGIVGSTSANPTVQVSLQNSSRIPMSTFFAPKPPDPGLFFTVFDQTVLAYFDPAEFRGVIEVQVDLIFNTFPAIPNAAQSIMLSGYELDCNVAPCAPIAH